MCSHSLLWGIFLTQGLNLGLLHCRWILYDLSHQGSPRISMWNAGLDGSQAEIKIAGRNINSLRSAGDATLMAKSKEEKKSLLMRVKEESEKACLKLSFLKTKITASSPITSWQTDREKVETVEDFILLSSKITVDGDCRDEIKRCFLLGRKAMTNLNSIFKSRDITFPIKVCIVKAIVFLVIIYYGCDCWTIKQADGWRIDAFKLWCWRRLLRALWTERR